MTDQPIDQPAAAPSGETPAPAVRKYPGWVRLGVIVGGSAGTWAALVLAGRSLLA